MLTDFALQVITILVIADAVIIGDILSGPPYNLWKSGHSARVNAQKALNALVALGRLERGKSFYRLPGCKSEYGEHAQLVTRHIADLIKLNLPLKTFREHTISKVGLRPDAICLITKDNQSLCFILEVIHNETSEYFKQKLSTWKTWDGATDYLGQLFGYEIPCFSIITAGQRLLFDEVLTLDDLLMEVKK